MIAIHFIEDLSGKRHSAKELNISYQYTKLGEWTNNYNT